MAFFSSMLSFTSNAGQSSYAAACRFEDAFGAHLQRRASYPVTVINWGYWREIGIVSDERYARKLAARGILGLGTADGIAALERVLSAGVAQVLVLRAEPAFLKELGVTGDPVDGVSIDRETMRSELTYPGHVSRLLTPSATSEDFETIYAAVDRYATVALRQVPEISRASVLPQYQQLLAVIEREREETTFKLNGTCSISLQETIRKHPEMRAYLTLLDRCLEALPDILTGKRAATDIIFPDASLDLVKGVYTSNRIADFFNDKLAQSVREIVAAKQEHVSEPIRIIEIGAGTGGTTAAVLKAIESIGQRSEYVYTDVSKHFLDHGARHFKSNGELTFSLLDIEKDVATQSIQPGSFDVVIASNVLHATSDIERTLGNVKSLLRRDGVVVINEVSSVRLITTLTFGLLPGWWRFADPERRLPQSPLLNPVLWQKVLESAGFEDVFRLGQEGKGVPVVQDIYFATSNGEVATKAGDETAARECGFDVIREPLPMPESEAIEALVIDSLVESLRLDREVFDRRVPFTDFGIDSITAVEVINSLNVRCGTTLRSTDIFNYPDIPALAGRLAELNVSVPPPEIEQDVDQVRDAQDREEQEDDDPLLLELNRLAAGETTVAETERLLNGVTR
jgi:ubiquinone/menaquinone biosynthesis C-methylase UbiE/acyl carrier protein